MKNDARSTTGQNLRNMMLLFNKNSIDEIEEKDIIEYVYAPVENKDEWKLQVIEELIDVKNKELEIGNLSFFFIYYPLPNSMIQSLVDHNFGSHGGFHFLFSYFA